MLLEISRKIHIVFVFQKEKRFEVESCHRHFDTWKNIWGRPGHGAPMQHVQRNNLLRILYYPCAVAYQKQLSKKIRNIISFNLFKNPSRKINFLFFSFLIKVNLEKKFLSKTMITSIKVFTCLAKNHFSELTRKKNSIKY